MRTFPITDNGGTVFAFEIPAQFLGWRLARRLRDIPGVSDVRPDPDEMFEMVTSISRIVGEITQRSHDRTDLKEKPQEKPDEESQANYRPSSYYFGWTGLATRHGREVLFEIRVLRGKAAIQAGQLLAVSSFLVFIPLADWRLAFLAIVVEGALLWWLWRTFGREKNIAKQIVEELCRKFQGEWWPDASQRGI
jgi:hypothetical protein